MDKVRRRGGKKAEDALYVTSVRREPELNDLIKRETKRNKGFFSFLAKANKWKGGISARWPRAEVQA